MADHDMGLLDTCGICRWHDNGRLRMSPAETAVAAGQAHGVNALRLGLVKCRQDIDGGTRGGQADKDIARAPQCFHLAGKYPCKSKIVGGCGQGRGIGGQGDGRESLAVFFKADGEFGGDMLTICSAAAIAAKKQLAAGFKGIYAQPRQVFNLGQQIAAAFGHGNMIVKKVVE